MARYIDGYVLVVPTRKLDEYRKMAKKAGKIWMKHGALQYVETIGEDMKPNTKGMKIPTFPDLTNPKPSETVLFSFIVFKSRSHRDRVNANVMEDPEMSDPAWEGKPMPFDMKRMHYGGFETIVDLE